jgi:hypothetical protein
VDAKADLPEHQAERAAALSAAPAVDERRPLARQLEHVALEVRGDVARREDRAALSRGEGRDLLVLGAHGGALGVVERRPVDRAGQPVERVLAFRAGVDDRAEVVEPLDRVGGGDGNERHRGSGRVRR